MMRGVGEWGRVGEEGHAEGGMGGSGRGALTSKKYPEVNASPISPSLIAGCVHTNITNHYEGSIWSG